MSNFDVKCVICFKAKNHYLDSVLGRDLGVNVISSLILARKGD